MLKGMVVRLRMGSNGTDDGGSFDNPRVLPTSGENPNFVRGTSLKMRFPKEQTGTAKRRPIEVTNPSYLI